MIAAAWRTPARGLLAGALLAVAAAPARGQVYLHDDGSSENALSLNAEGGLCWLQRYEAAGGADTIVSVSTSFGSAVHGCCSPPAGTPITVCVWEDPNDDGDPVDAVLLSSAPGLLEHPNTNVLTEYPVPPAQVSGTFFVGCYLEVEPGDHVAPSDYDAGQSNGRAWVAGAVAPDRFDPRDLAANLLIEVDEIIPGLGWVWLLRARGAGVVSYCYDDGSGAACPCGNEGGAGRGCANSSGAGALAVSAGSASALADDLEVHASDLVPGQAALLFAGESAPNEGQGLPFGDGLRCAGTNVRRLGLRAPDAGGAASWGPELGALGGWNAGDTRYLQVWYRDPAGPCGSTFNLSNGLEVVFGA
jgi:hypothetical protein